MAAPPAPPGSPDDPAPWEAESWEAELHGAIFDPDTSPPDGDDAWLADLPAALREPFLRPVTPAAGPEVLTAGFWDRAEPHGTGFASGGPLDTLAPGPVLAAFTSHAWSAGLGQLSDDELIGVLRAARRMCSWQAALELEAVAELGARRDARAAESGDQRASAHTADELAAALTLTGWAADTLLQLACGLGRLAGVRAALADGVIDRARAVVFAQELAAVDDDHAAAIEAAILPKAGQMTTGQLRAALRRAVLAIDPDAAIKRREKAEQDARVEAWQETSGTGALSGRDLPPAEVIAADKRLDVFARWLKNHGMEGSHDQLRAMSYTALLLGRPLDTLLPAAPGLAPAPDQGSDLAGLRGPGAAPRPAYPDAGPASGPGPAGVAGWAAGSPGWAAGSPDAPAGLPGSVNLTMPLASYLGGSNSPGEVAGLGPLDAAACRDLAAAIAAAPSSRWCLTLTDRDGRAVAHGCARTGPGPPGSHLASWLSGLKLTLLESAACTHQRETHGYRPSAALRHLVKIRQRTCSFPGCRRPAIRCDDDHTIPYDQGGRTCECNISPLCRRHHQAKQAPGWHLEQPQPGVLIWTLPHGRKYATVPGTYPV